MISRAFSLKLGRFGVVGLVSTLIYAVIAAIGNNWTALPAEAVNSIAISISGLWSYIGHYRFTFRSDAAHGSSLARFFVLFALGYAVSSGIVLVSDRLGWQRNLATAIIVIIIPVINFVAMQLWVFAQSHAGPRGGSEPGP
ncbi:MAG: GtrA family protein [Aliidongia sp.]